jgi:hypothetical protein
MNMKKGGMCEDDGHIHYIETVDKNKKVAYKIIFPVFEFYNCPFSYFLESSFPLFSYYERLFTGNWRLAKAAYSSFLMKNKKERNCFDHPKRSFDDLKIGFFFVFVSDRRKS